ncbi:uncharacterized protein LOC122788638 [Protopterus annectens]|uniref:uncharacterized protein LOC122788638 n=1 Tax=Protopterus annectens TaxID=7888 RepID=UPI001CFAE9D2|nr:uncharacterized protein LOC122788638 [Protopterus annectens]
MQRGLDSSCLQSWHTVVLICFVLSRCCSVSAEITCRSCRSPAQVRHQGSLSLPHSHLQSEAIVQREIMENSSGHSAAEMNSLETKQFPEGLQVSRGDIRLSGNSSTVSNLNISATGMTMEKEHVVNVKYGQKLSKLHRKVEGTDGTSSGHEPKGLNTSLRLLKEGVQEEHLGRWKRSNSASTGPSEGQVKLIKPQPGAEDRTSSLDQRAANFLPDGRRVADRPRTSPVIFLTEELKLTTSTFSLTGDSAHNQAVVHWSGQNSSVILILTKLYDYNLGSVTESSLWR